MEKKLWLVTCQSRVSKQFLLSDLRKLESEQTKKLDDKQVEQIKQLYNVTGFTNSQIGSLGGSFGVYFNIYYDSLDEVICETKSNPNLQNRICLIYDGKPLLMETIKHMLCNKIDLNNLIYFNKGWLGGDINDGTYVFGIDTDNNRIEISQDNLEKEVDSYLKRISEYVMIQSRLNRYHNNPKFRESLLELTHIRTELFRKYAIIPFKKSENYEEFMESDKGIEYVLRVEEGLNKLYEIAPEMKAIMEDIKNENKSYFEILREFDEKLNSLLRNEIVIRWLVYRHEKAGLIKTFQNETYGRFIGGSLIYKIKYSQ